MKKLISFIAELNLPNKLTLLRIALVPVYLVLLALGMNWAALVVFAAASLTDMLDGKIARKYNLITNFGKFMDPIADKLLTHTAFIMLCAMGRLNVVPVERAPAEGYWDDLVHLERHRMSRGQRVIYGLPADPAGIPE